MTIDRIGVTQRWCDAAIFNGIVFLAGHVAEKTEGRSLREQTTEVLALLEETLEAAGSDKSKLLLVTLYLREMADYAAMNAVWDAWLPAGSAPARACIEAKLAHPGYRIEAVVIAAR